MKFHLLHNNTRRNKNTSLLDSSTDTNVVNKSPANNILWTIFHFFCCLISLILGFRFSRMLFYLLLTTANTPNSTFVGGGLTFTTSLRNANNNNKTGGGGGDVVVPASRVVVGRHGIRIRPWPHPDPNEVIKAHKIIESVQREQKAMYGVKNARSLIVVTPTYVRTFQSLHLTGLMHTLMNVGYDVVWIVVEAGGVSNETEGLLAKAKGRLGLEVKHIGFEKKMPVFWSGRHELESEMRLHALRVVREEKLDGIVMFADDSNMHSLELFDEVQKVEWIGAVSVGIIAHSSRSDEEPFEVVKKVDKLDEKKSALPVQGPACNSSDKLVGWHTFDSRVYQQKSANYIGDMAVVLPRKVEWCGFVMNSRLVWEESEFRPDWIKDLDMVVSAGADGVGKIESPLSFVEDSSMVEPLGGCGKKVMMWWLRAEARADSKFPAGWTIDPQLEVTVPAKRTPWPELPPNTEKVMRDIRENAQKNPRKPRSRRSSRGKRKHEAKNTDTHAVVRSSGERSE